MPEQTNDLSQSLGEPDISPSRESVAGQLLIRVLQSPKFQRALDYAAVETRTSGYETGFTVFVDQAGTNMIPFVNKGGGDALFDRDLGGFPEDVLAELDGYEGYLEATSLLAKYIDLHFHPDEELTPSATDLLSAYGQKNNDQIPSYIMIGSVDDRGEITVLCTKKPEEEITQRDLKYYSSETRNVSIETVIKILEKLGIEAFMIRFNLRRTKEGKRYGLSSESKKTISSQGQSTAYFSSWI